MAYQPYNFDDLQELTDDDYRKMKVGDDSWYYRCNDTLPYKPLGIERPVKAILEVYAGGLKQFGFYITFKVDNNGNEETFQAEVYITPQGSFHVPHFLDWRIEKLVNLLKVKAFVCTTAVKEGLLMGSKTN